MTRREIQKIIYNIFSENTMFGVYSPADTLFDMAPLRPDSEKVIKQKIRDRFGLKITQSLMNMRADNLITVIYIYILNRQKTITNNFLRARLLETRLRQK